MGMGNDKRQSPDTPARPRAVVIPVEGPVRVETLPKDGSELSYLQGCVGGWIEAVDVEKVLTDSGRKTVNCTMFVNEEGKIIGLPVNPRATDFAALAIGGWVIDAIMGDAVVVGQPDDEGETTGCPDEVLRVIDRWGWPIETVGSGA